jgi:parallel beta-helix repeat protein
MKAIVALLTAGISLRNVFMLAWLVTAACSSATNGTATTMQDETVIDGGSADARPPCVGTRLLPGADTIQTAVKSAPAGTTFCLAAGEYRLTTPITPKSNQVFIGAGMGQTVLLGSTLETAWTKSGSRWYADVGAALDGSIYDRNGSTETSYYSTDGSDNRYFSRTLGDTFLNGKRLVRIGELYQGTTAGAPGVSASSVVSGQFFADYDEHHITIGDDPSGNKLEIALSPIAFDGTAVSGVTVSYLSLLEFANQNWEPGQSPIEPGTNWTVDHVDSSYNHARGLQVGPGIRVTNSRFIDNGAIGTGGGTTGVLIDSCDYEQNNQGINFLYGIGSAGVKFGATNDTIVRNSTFNANAGVGIWFDCGSRFNVVENNTVTGNTQAGIAFEISYEAIARNNTVTGNGEQGGGVRANIGIPSSGAADPSYPLDSFWIGMGGTASLEVYGNTVDNAGGVPAILLGQADRSVADPSTICGPQLTANGTRSTNNVHVRGNTFTIASRAAVAVAQSVPTPPNPDIYKNGNTFVGNAYDTGGSCGSPHWYWQNTNLTFAQWQAYGLDPAPSGVCK